MNISSPLAVGHQFRKFSTGTYGGVASIAIAPVKPQLFFGNIEAPISKF
jgi:hypothetical protein